MMNGVLGSANRFQNTFAGGGIICQSAVKASSKKFLIGWFQINTMVLTSSFSNACLFSITNSK